MEKIILETENGKYAGLFQKGNKFNHIAIIYYHGLGGKSKIVQPLIKYFNDFDFFSMEERGHVNSLQKASVSTKKHDNDISNVVCHLKKQYKKIYLCGESMGALFSARQAFKKNNNIDGIFVWSIPFYPKDITTIKKIQKFKNILKIIVCFLIGKNFQYNSTIDYPKLTNSKFLMKLNELNVQTPNNTSEEIAIWKASLSIKRKLINKKPFCPVYYWQGENDIMSNDKIIKKINEKNYSHAYIIPRAKHILMFEDGSEIMWKKIDQIIRSNLN